jgi:DNA-binding XRE family transcriptional regulator
MIRGQDWTPVVVNKKKPVVTVNPRVVKDPVIKTFDSTCRTNMMQARAAQKLTQDQLNNLAQLPKYTVRDVEVGKLCPSPGQMNTLSRILRIPLHYTR